MDQTSADSSALSVALALIYVLQNHLHHHSGPSRPGPFDRMSSAVYFDGFAVPVPRWSPHGFVPPEEPPVAEATTWLLRVGWRRLGLLGLRDVPA